MWGCFLLTRELRLAVCPVIASICVCFWSGLTAHGALRLASVTNACSVSWSRQQLPGLLQGQLFLCKLREMGGKKGPCFPSPGDGQPFAPSQHYAVTAFSLLAPQQRRLMVRMLLLGASTRLQSWRCAACFGSSEPCGKPAAMAHPSPAGDKVAFAGTRERLAKWLAGSWATTVEQSTAPDGEQDTQLAQPAQLSLGLNDGTAMPVPVLSSQAWWQLSQHWSSW